MSRNLGRTDCAFCSGKVVVGEPRPITKDDCGIYFDSYEGMIVAESKCSFCEAPYLAWLDDTRTARHGGYFRPSLDEDGKPEAQDLSHLHSFNDEPRKEDYPKYRKVFVREPWPMCIVCGAPVAEYGNECADWNARHKQECTEHEDCRANRELAVACSLQRQSDERPEKA